MIKKAFCCAIRYYQKFIRPFVGQTCRFTPSCSEYALQALNKHGFIKGGFKGIRRLCSCHPFSGKAGYDPLT